MRFMTFLTGFLLVSTGYGQSVVTPVFVHTDGEVSASGYSGSDKEFLVDGGSSDGTQNIIDCMKKQEIKRLVVVTALGVGDTRERVSLSFKMLMKTVLRKAYEDKERQEQFVRESGLDWIIVRPGGLTNGPATGEYEFGLDPAIGGGQVSRADVAAFVLQQLTDDTFLHQTPAIA